MNQRYLRTDAREAAHIDSDLARVLQFIETSDSDGMLIEETIFLLTERIGRIEELASTDGFAEIAEAAQDISGKAGMIGLVLLSGVAGDLAACAARRDPAACAAVSARLLRVGSDSIFYLSQCME